MLLICSIITLQPPISNLTNWEDLVVAYRWSRVVIKSRGPGIFPGYKESGPQLLLSENRSKIEPKEIPRHLIPHLLVVFTRQLEILVTTVQEMVTYENPTVRGLFQEADLIMLYSVIVI